MKILLPLLCISLSVAADSDLPVLDRDGRQAIIQKIVSKQPSDREVMYIEMLYVHINKTIRYDKKALSSLVRELSNTSDRQFQKRYQVDPKYGHWMLRNLEEMQIYNQNKKIEIKRFAIALDEAGHTIGSAAEHTSNHKLLFLIQYLSQQPHHQIIMRPNDKGINPKQLMVVLQAELNGRKG